MVTAVMRRLLDALPAEHVPSVLRREGEGRRLALGTAASFTLNVAGTGLALVLQVLVARAIGDDGYGIYLYVLGWMNVALLFGRFDFDIVATRFVGAYHAQQDWPHLHGFLRRGRQFVALLSIGLAAAGALTIHLLRDSLAPATVTSGLLACALMPVTALLVLSGAMLQGLKEAVRAQAPNVVLRPLLFLLIVGTILLASDARAGAPMAMLANLAATAIALGVSTWFLRRQTPSAARSAVPAYEMSEWVRAGAWFVFIDVFQLAISQQSDVLVVGTMVSTTDAAHYGAASQLATLVHFGATAVIFMAAPMIAGLHAKGEQRALQRLLGTAALVNLALSLPIVLLLAVGGRYLLGWYGPEFVAGYTVLLLLATSQLVAAFAGTMAGTLMSMTGRQAHAAWIVAASAVLNLALAIPLTRQFGLVGTATATLCATTMRSITLALYIRKQLGLSLLPVLPRR